MYMPMPPPRAPAHAAAAVVPPAAAAARPHRLSLRRLRPRPPCLRRLRDRASTAARALATDRLCASPASHTCTACRLRAAATHAGASRGAARPTTCPAACVDYNMPCNMLNVICVFENPRASPRPYGWGGQRERSHGEGRHAMGVGDLIPPILVERPSAPGSHK